MCRKWLLEFQVCPELTNQIIVTVVTDEWPDGCGVGSSGISAGITHQTSVSLGEQCGGEDTCQSQLGRRLCQHFGHCTFLVLGQECVDCVMEHVLGFAGRWCNHYQFDNLLPLSVSVGPNPLSHPFTYFTPMLFFIHLNIVPKCLNAFRFSESIY